jgi:hypothetical protein
VTATDIFARAGVDATRDETARQAVLEGRKLVPTLTSYARALTHDPHVLVEMATRDNGSTNGKKIFWRPPIALGDRTPHQRVVCNKRGPDGHLLCSACSNREDVLVVIYHEIAHLCFDSFQEVSDADKANLVSDAIELANGQWAKQIKDRINSAPAWVKKSYIGIAGLVSDYMPLLVNSLEDARVNRELFKVRKGTKSMFDSQVNKVFNEGVEQLNKLGNLVNIPWSEYPLNAQAVVGTFALGSGYQIQSHWFAPNVVEALADKELNRLVRQLDTTRSAAGVYHLAFPVLARLRELGFCKMPDEPEEEPENEEEPDLPADETGSEEPEEGEPNDSEESDSGTDSKDGLGDGEPGDTDAEPGDSEDSDPSADQDSPDSGSEAGSSSEASEGGDNESEPGQGGSSGGEDSKPEHGGSREDGSGSSGGESSGGQGDFSSDDTGDSEKLEGDLPSSGSDQEDDSSEDAREGEQPRSDPSDGAPADQPKPSSESAPADHDKSAETVDEDSSGQKEADSDPSEPSGLEEGDDHSRDDSDDGAGSSSAVPPESTGSSSEVLDEDDHLDPSDSSGEDDLHDGDLSGSEKLEPAESEGRSPEQEDGNPELDGIPDAPESDSGEPIDTGADKGVGGTEVVENPENDDKPLPDPGTPEDAETALLKLGNHEEPPKRLFEENEANSEAVDRAIIQGMYFETPSRNIFGVREHKFGSPIVVDGRDMSQAWSHTSWIYAGHSAAQLGTSGDFDPPETILGPALTRMRVTFTDNARGKDEPHLKSGRVNGRVLGRRAWAEDERLFRRRIQPGKKSYFVLIGMDVSGSTLGRNIQLEKRAVMAQAELCHRMGIKFAVFAHSGNHHSPRGTRGDGLDLDIYVIKDDRQPWNEDTKAALREIGPDSANLDGHTLEYYRKYIQRRPETDKVILYYTDGKMPAENFDEELVILEREIKVCKRQRITLLGVGIRTNSPVRHGLDTVEVTTDEDIVKVVRHLEKRLSVHF